jgi:hypothetical protein
MPLSTCITDLFGSLTRHQECPPFWIALPEQGLPFIDRLRQAKVVSIGRSAGGHDIPALEYGTPEPLDATTDNLASALAATTGKTDPTAIYPPAFFGTRRRRAPVIVLQGAIHGGEITGTVAALNLCRIIETGVDLRDKEWPRLAELARATRLVVIPWLNMDGARRCLLPNPGGASAELLAAATFGVAKDNKPHAYLAVKNLCPVPPSGTAFMGSYFNDAGYNLQYDFCLPERQPETTAWMKYYLAERPDGVLVMHGNAGSLIGPPEAFLPVGAQHEITRLGGAVRARLLRDGLPAGRSSWTGLPGMGREYLSQSNAIHHVCGALPVLCEFPVGAQPAVLAPDVMLDAGLTVLEEFLLHAHRDGLRPYEWREKAFA